MLLLINDHVHSIYSCSATYLKPPVGCRDGTTHDGDVDSDSEVVIFQ